MPELFFYFALLPTRCGQSHRVLLRRDISALREQISVSIFIQPRRHDMRSRPSGGGALVFNLQKFAKMTRVKNSLGARQARFEASWRQWT